MSQPRALTTTYSTYFLRGLTSTSHLGCPFAATFPNPIHAQLLTGVDLCYSDINLVVFTAIVTLRATKGLLYAYQGLFCLFPLPSLFSSHALWNYSWNGSHVRTAWSPQAGYCAPRKHMPIIMIRIPRFWEMKKKRSHLSLWTYQLIFLPYTWPIFFLQAFFFSDTQLILHEWLFFFLISYVVRR